MQGDGLLFYGLHVENGRIKGEAKKALREVIEEYNLNVRITPNQNMILCDIRPSWRPKIAKRLAAVGMVVSLLCRFLFLIVLCYVMSICYLIVWIGMEGVNFFCAFAVTKIRGSIKRDSHGLSSVAALPPCYR